MINMSKVGYIDVQRNLVGLTDSFFNKHIRLQLRDDLFELLDKEVKQEIIQPYITERGWRNEYLKDAEKYLRRNQ